jgi:hypothetical protein
MDELEPLEMLESELVWQGQTCLRAQKAVRFESLFHELVVSLLEQCLCGANLPARDNGIKWNDELQIKINR